MSNYYKFIKINDKDCLVNCSDEISKYRSDILKAFTVLRDSYDPQFANDRMFEKLKETTELLRETVKRYEITAR